MKSILALGAMLLSFGAYAQTTSSFSEKAVSTINEKSEKVIGTTYNDVKSATSVVYEDSKSLVKQVYEDGKSLAPDIKSAFQAVAKEFNTTVENLWNILVRQQYVWSIGYTIILLLTILAWFKFGSSFKKTHSDLSETGELKIVNIVYTVAMFSLAVYGTIHVGDSIDRMLTGYINPEFGAVRTIVEFIKQ